ncbi:hypothetical protein [Enterococcus malodoratus]|uniref:hypothetical protein n=1 Tax=Enterococcus malodoratus TaxID=71451 RepID=UPI0039B060FE
MIRKDLSKKKFICLFVVFCILFSFLFPTLSLGTANEETSSSQPLSETLNTNDLLPTIDSPLDEAAVSNESSVAGTEPESTSESSSVQSESTIPNETPTKEARASTQNILNAVVVSEWELYRDNDGTRESLTVDPKSSAVPNQAYHFSFDWTIAADKLGRNLLPNDYFILTIPQNENRDSGHWYAVPSGWSTVTTEDGESIYRYRIENSATENTQVVRVEFLAGVDKLHINTLESTLTF